MQPIIFKQSFPIAVLTALMAILPPVVGVTSLYVIARVFDENFDNTYIALSVLVATLSALLLNTGPSTTSQFSSSRIPIVAGIVFRWVILISILFVLGYVTKLSVEYSRRIVLLWSVVTPALLIFTNLALHEVMRRVLFASTNSRLVAFAGCNEISISLAERIRNNPDMCMRVAGFFDDRGPERLGVNSKVGVIAKLADLPRFVQERRIDVLFVALPIRHVKRVMDMLDDLRDTTVSIYYVPDIFVFDLIQARTDDILGIPVVAMCETPFYGFRGVFKRLTDISLAALCLLLVAPVMLIVALLVKTSKGPVLFKQRRYGLDGREILVYKFRTMVVAEDGSSVRQASRDDERITPVGRFLRRYSLDELPQLINVLNGRMSLVGPLPHAVAHNEEYRKLIKGYMWRHKVLPGITGLAQINGCRGETSRLEEMEARVHYDLEYLRHWTPLLDVKILFLTAARMFRDSKAY